jgi:hypothetical protein
MKRFLILILVMMLFAVSASAQSLKYIGFKGGLNIFKPYGGDVGDAGYYYAYAVGGFYSHIFNEVFVLQPEIYYSVKGGKETDEDGESTLKLGYIDIPVLLKVNFPMEGKSWAPNLYAGPYLAFLTGADRDGHDVKGAFKSTDFGLIIGAGADFEMGEGKRLLNIDIRYSIGFTEIYDISGQDIKAFNNGFQFLLGYGFSL